MNAAWNTFVDGMSGKFVKPVDIALPAQKYDMGKPLGKKRTAVNTTAAAKHSTPVVTTERRVTNASRVRELIRVAKSEQRLSTADMVLEVMEKIGMSRSQATSYVKAHWDRV